MDTCHTHNNPQKMQQSGTTLYHTTGIVQKSKYALHQTITIPVAVRQNTNRRKVLSLLDTN